MASPLILNESEWKFEKKSEGQFEITNVLKQELLYLDVSSNNVFTAKLKDIPKSAKCIWNVVPEKNGSVSQGILQDLKNG